MRSHRVGIEHLTAPGTPNRPASDWGERGEPGVRGPLLLFGIKVGGPGCGWPPPGFDYLPIAGCTNSMDHSTDAGP
jgi:hypothetical protein